MRRRSEGTIGWRNVPAPPPRDREPDREQRQKRADPNHRVEGEVDRRRCRRLLVLGTSFRPSTTVSVLNPASRESRPSIEIAPFTSPSVQIPPIFSGWSEPVSYTHSIAANLTGWSS
jgi:hypothetical protein